MTTALSSAPPTDPPAFDPAAVRAECNKRLTVPREAKARPPYVCIEPREVAFIVERLPAARGRGRSGRAIAVWMALVLESNRKGARFMARVRLIANTIGVSEDFISAGLADLEHVGLVRRIGQPTPKGQIFELRTPRL